MSGIAGSTVAAKRIRRAGRGKIPWALHIMLAPCIVALFVYSYIPMLGAVIAFKDFDVVLGKNAIFLSPWVGFGNYIELWGMGIGQVLYNTVFIAILKIASQFVAPIVVAIMLNEVRSSRMKRTLQTTIYLPHFLSWVVIGGILKTVLSSNGLFNIVIQSLGLKAIPFLSSNAYFVSTLVVSDLWKEVGFATIVYLAAIAGIDPNLYEAAVVDGANRWQQTCHVTLPGMKAIMLLTLILSLQGVLNAGFDQVYNLYSVPVYETGDIIDTFVYRVTFGQAMYDIGAAVGLFKSVVSSLFIVVSYWMARRFAGYEIF